MTRNFILFILSVFLFSCSSTPELDLSDTKLYLYPHRIFLGEAASDFKFSEKERAKAKVAMKQQRFDILFEIYLNKNGTLKSIKTVKKNRSLDDKTVFDMRNQLKKDGFFKSAGFGSAFFYGIKITTSVEYL